ncbi:DUF4124 domain-containing protein [Massilia sp. CCM 8733]|uniref:DUF4124 domain-containing protein n=1 Tax=Massilia mucilaginosa TaxID=2609282 RepID=A0ABX0NZ99_9BURK|nr:DUF4124 domain-containing protein [Massilia mucilaginosa]NHZ92334.1 DUF4124 domain-containing protein [Massilia mucilaginosa]
MLRHLTILGLLALCGAASADTIYKCTAGGKITYSGAPCTEGRATALDAMPAPAGADADAARTLERQKAMLATLQKERASSDARQAKAAQEATHINRVSAGRQADCARMRQKQQKEQKRLAAEAAKVGGQGKIERDLDAEAMAKAVDAACSR